MLYRDSNHRLDEWVTADIVGLAMAKEIAVWRKKEEERQHKKLQVDRKKAEAVLEKSATAVASTDGGATVVCISKRQKQQSFGDQ